MLPSQSPPPNHESAMQPECPTRGRNTTIRTREPAGNSQNPETFCKLKYSTWFVIHSIIVTLLNIPVLVISSRYPGLIILPFTYNVILLAAAVWKNVKALIVVITLAFLTLPMCALLFVFVPTLYGFDNGTRYSSEKNRLYIPSILEVVHTAVFTEFPVLILVWFIMAQLILAFEVLMEETDRKDRRRSDRIVAIA